MTSAAPPIRRWVLTGVGFLLIGAGQIVLGYGFGHFDLDLGLGSVFWAVLGVVFLMKATVERVRWVRQERERAGLRDHANGV